MLFSSAVLSLPLEIISPSGEQLGFLLGVSHTPMLYTKSYTNLIEQVTSTATDFFVELDNSKIPTREAQREFFGLDKPSVRTLAQQTDVPCISQMIQLFDKINHPSKYLLDFPVQPFYAAIFKGPAGKNKPKSASDAEAYTMEDFIKSKFKQAIEIEGWYVQVAGDRALPADLVLETSEATCKNFYGFKNSRLFMQLPTHPIMDFDELVGWGIKGEYDLLRQNSKEKFTATGQNMLFWDASFPQREVYQANEIDRILKKGLHKKPLFTLGMLHLGGSDGVISLLQSKGYKLQPVLTKLP